MARVIKKQKPFYVLEGKFTSHVLKMQEMEEQVKRYFIWSPFWKALDRQISLISHQLTENRCLIDIPKTEETCYVKNCRSSSGVSFKEVKIYGMTPNQVMFLTIKVEWVLDDFDFTRCYELRPIPFDLVDDFTDQKFDTWVEKMLAVKEAKLEKEELAQIRKLRVKYPKEFVKQTPNV